MSVFLDTSALFAVLDADDRYHAGADKVWRELIAGTEDLVSSNYVLVETFALIQRRLGMEAVRSLEEDILPLVRVIWSVSPTTGLRWPLFSPPVAES